LFGFCPAEPILSEEARIGLIIATRRDNAKQQALASEETRVMNGIATNPGPRNRRRFLRRRRKGERGQALVEFSMVALVFFILVFGVIDFGMALHSWITVTNAAREGARIGAVHAASDGSTDCNPAPTAGTIEAKVCETGTNLDPDNMTLTVTNADPEGDDAGEPVSVQVDYTYDLITPLLNILNLSTINISSESQMRLE
jgi:Flp pilus assembly protein TadG